MRNAPEHTKEKIVVAATKLFSEQGIHRVSFQQIATKVGISQPALYKHVADRDDLLRLCVIDAAAKGRQLIDSNIDLYSSASQQIRSYIEGNFIWVDKFPKEAKVLFSIYYFGYHSQAIREILTEINQQSVSRIGIRISAGKREGLWGVANVAEAARVIHDLTLSEIFKALHAKDDITVKQRTDLVWRASEKILMSF